MVRPAQRCLLSFVLLLSGCNFLQIRRDEVERTFADYGVRPHRAQVDDAEIHYYAGEGASPPLLLLHGFGSAAIWEWQELVPGFAARHRVIAPDLLWFGESDSRDPDPSLDHQARAMLALLDHLGIDRVDVLGSSYGGLVAVELAALAPHRVRRVVLIDSPGRAYTRADYDALCERFGVESAAELFVPQDDAAMRMLLSIAVRSPPWVPDFALSSVREALFSEHRAQRVALLDSLASHLEELRARPGPAGRVLIVWGSEDPVFPLPIARRLAASLGPRATLEVVEGARHAPHLDEPERVRAWVEEELRPHPRVHDDASTAPVPSEAVPSETVP